MIPAPLPRVPVQRQRTGRRLHCRSPARRLHAATRLEEDRSQTLLAQEPDRRRLHEIIRSRHRGNPRTRREERPLLRRPPCCVRQGSWRDHYPVGGPVNLKMNEHGLRPKSSIAEAPLKG